MPTKKRGRRGGRLLFHLIFFFSQKKEEAGRLLSDLIFCYYDTLTYKDVVSLNSASPGITELNLDLSETKPATSAKLNLRPQPQLRLAWSNLSVCACIDMYVRLCVHICLCKYTHIIYPPHPPLPLSLAECERYARILSLVSSYHITQNDQNGLIALVQDKKAIYSTTILMGGWGSQTLTRTSF
jgi:hypothetical protein